MGKREAWKSHLEKAFSSSGDTFAGHPHDIESAQKALMSALRKDVGFKTFVNAVRSTQKKLIERDAKRNGSGIDKDTAKHFRTRLNKKVRLIETYFKYD